MCFLSSPADDAPAPIIREPSPSIPDLHRERDYLHMHGGNVMRMLEGCRARDGSYNRAVIDLTVNSARNALENALQTLNAVEAECRAIDAERALLVVFSNCPPAPKPFSRRVPDAALPLTVSPGALA